MKLISSFISNIKSNKCSLCTRLLGPGKNCAFTWQQKKMESLCFQAKGQHISKLNHIIELNYEEACMHASCETASIWESFKN